MAGTPHPRSSQAWVRHGVVFDPTEPWEHGDAPNFPSSVELIDASNGLFRLWYTVIDRTGDKPLLSMAVAEGSIGGPWKRQPIVLSEGEPRTDAGYSVGNLPARWRAGQPIHIQLKDTGRHRLYFWTHDWPVIRYLVAESDDGRHYRVLDPHRPVLYHLYDRAVLWPVNYMGLNTGSRDMQRPENEPPAPNELVTNDATTIYQLPDGSFELYTAALVTVDKDDPRHIAHDNAPGKIRVVDRFTSTDGLRFTNRKRVIERDADDPIDLQFYYLAVTRTERGCVGLLGHYPCQAQTMDIEWCFSPDGEHWQRSHRRGWLPRAKPGQAVDSYRAYSPCNLIHHDNRWWLFYTGCNFAHNYKDVHGPTMQRRIMLASIDRLFE